jgi:outer membrane protein OmpA-like peptidoglycan-associated protein
MDNPLGKPADSVKRFSQIKWAVAGAILVLLVLAWIAGPGQVEDSAGKGPAAGTDAAGSSDPGAAGIAAAATTLALDLAADGGLKVGGVVADEATRNQWLNEIRIGAQGRPVADQLQVGPVVPTKADWTSHLSGLVAVMRERQLASLRVEGDRVLLQGQAKDPGVKAETESMIQSQLPSGYRVDSKLALGASPAGAARAPAGSTPRASASSDASPSGSSGSSAAAGSPSAAAPSADVPAAGASAARSTGAPASGGDRADLRASAQTEPGPESATTESKKPVRKPANCPRQLRPLAQPVYFKTDASAIPSEDRARLQRLGECLGRARVRIIGHADPRHTDDYNQELSERRARAVAEVLATAGADPARITVVGAGKAKAPSKKPSRQALQRARRVDIQVR